MIYDKVYFFLVDPVSRYSCLAVKTDWVLKPIKKAAVSLSRNEGARHVRTLGFREFERWKSMAAYDITRMR